MNPRINKIHVEFIVDLWKILGEHGGQGKTPLVGGFNPVEKY